MNSIVALCGVLLAIQLASAFHGGRHGGYGGHHGGYEHGGFGGHHGGYVEEIVEPVIPVAGGLVDSYSYVESYFPGSTYDGYGTYGPAYGGHGYPLEAYGHGYGHGYGHHGGHGGYGLYGGWPKESLYKRSPLAYREDEKLVMRDFAFYNSTKETVLQPRAITNLGPNT